MAGGSPALRAAGQRVMGAPAFWQQAESLGLGVERRQEGAEGCSGAVSRRGVHCRSGRRWRGRGSAGEDRQHWAGASQ